MTRQLGKAACKRRVLSAAASANAGTPRNCLSLSPSFSIKSYSPVSTPYRAWRPSGVAQGLHTPPGTLMPVVEPAAIQESKDGVQVSIENCIAVGSYQNCVVPSDALPGPLQRLSNWRGTG